MISALPVSGAWQPKITGAQLDRPRISFSRQSLTAPCPWPPSSGPRWVAHRPWERTACLSGSMTFLIVSLGGVNARWGQIRSSGSTFSRTNASAQSSFSWNSGSVSKSHDIAALSLGSENRRSHDQRRVPRPVALTQAAFVQLPVRLARQLAREVDRARALVRRQLGPAEGDRVNIVGTNCA